EGFFRFLFRAMDIMAKLGTRFYFSELQGGILAGCAHEVLLLVFGQVTQTFEVDTLAVEIFLDVIPF
ncbi:MAG: hypothetical protein MUO57_07980, partial [Anaerolineales bacterium]|nr:hypothetical protein [Anaerolineales bacterium]